MLDDGWLSSSYLIPQESAGWSVRYAGLKSTELKPQRPPPIEHCSCSTISNLCVLPRFGAPNCYSSCLTDERRIPAANHKRCQSVSSPRSTRLRGGISPPPVRLAEGVTGIHSNLNYPRLAPTRSFKMSLRSFPCEYLHPPLRFETPTLSC